MKKLTEEQIRSIPDLYDAKIIIQEKENETDEEEYVYIVRWLWQPYTTAYGMMMKVQEAFPNAKIQNYAQYFGEVDPTLPFALQNHYWCKFTFNNN